MRNLDMQLAIDIGNSAAKVGLFEQHRLMKTATLATDDLLHALTAWPAGKAIISSVDRSKADSLLPGLRQLYRHVLELTPATPLPFGVRYQTPHSLGVDRLAAAAGALVHARPPVAVVDAGTCITCDLVNSQGQFVGGVISPGLRMRLQAMHRFTAALPYPELAEPTAFPGRSTEEAMLHGALTGARHEVAGYLRSYRQAEPHLQVFVCGGDVQYFDKINEFVTFAHSNLVLEGLNAILLFNEKL